MLSPRANAILLATALLSGETLADAFAFVEDTINTNSDGACFVFSIDIDGDGDVDSISASTNDDTIAWLENENGDGSSWTKHVISTIPNSPRSVWGGDVDGDGDVDVMSASFQDDTINWFENVNGDGSLWTRHEISTEADRAHSVVGVDVDNDGDIDAMSASYGDDTIAWFENVNGDGSMWTRHVISDEAEGAYSVVGIDVDSDGDVDVLAALFDGDSIVWYENDNGDESSWTSHDIATGIDGASSVFGIDFDLDGDIDAMSTSQNDNIVNWYENDNGDGSSWTTHLIADDAIGPMSVFGIDVDNDGDIDAFSASRYTTGDYTVAWHENAGDGTYFTSHEIDDDADGARSVFGIDVDGDGDVDAFSASKEDDKIAWYENMCSDCATPPPTVVPTSVPTPAPTLTAKPTITPVPTVTLKPTPKPTNKPPKRRSDDDDGGLLATPVGIAIVVVSIILVFLFLLLLIFALFRWIEAYLDKNDALDATGTGDRAMAHMPEALIEIPPEADEASVEVLGPQEPHSPAPDTTDPSTGLVVVEARPIYVTPEMVYAEPIQVRERSERTF